MKVVFEHIINEAESSFTLLQLSLPRFESSYHMHSELELTFIENDSGKRIVAGNIASYQPRDLLLIGSNTPHCWLSERDSCIGTVNATVIQFNPEIFGNQLLELTELIAIKKLLERLKTALIIKGVTRDAVIEKMRHCALSSGLPRLLLLMDILHTIAISPDIEFIGSQQSGYNYSQTETARFNKVFSYIIEHYKSEIVLESVAKVANMSPTAFCRYFKKTTHKTLVTVVTEFRINHACLLLRTTEKAVTEICYESGFGNTSYFNKTFKTHTGDTPLDYRKRFL